MAAPLDDALDSDVVHTARARAAAPAVIVPGQIQWADVGKAVEQVCDRPRPPTSQYT